MGVSKQRVVGIFEPWGLGDLCIALIFAHEIFLRGNKSVVVCAPEWAGFVASLPFVDAAVPFSAPWARKRGKYRIDAYHLPTFARLKRELCQRGVTDLADLRGDPRNIALFCALLRARFYSLLGQTPVSRYDRPARMLKKFGVSPPDRDLGRGILKSVESKRASRRVVCFFGATWRNKCLPLTLAEQLLCELASANWRPCLLVLPDDAEYWRGRAVKLNSIVDFVFDTVEACCRKMAASDFCISTDSGWMHVAYLYDIPVVGLFGFDNYKEWAPPGCLVVKSSPCLPAADRFQLDQETEQPLKNLDISRVIRALNSLSEDNT